MNGTDHGDFWHSPNQQPEETDIQPRRVFDNPVVSGRISVLYSSYSNGVMSLYLKELNRDILLGQYPTEVSIDMNKIPYRNAIYSNNTIPGGGGVIDNRFRIRSAFTSGFIPLPSVPYTNQRDFGLNQVTSTFELENINKMNWSTQTTFSPFRIYHDTFKVEPYIPPSYSTKFRSNISNNSQINVTLDPPTEPNNIYAFQAQQFRLGFSGGGLPEKSLNILSETTIHSNDFGSYISGAVQPGTLSEPVQYEDDFSTDTSYSWTVAHMFLRFSFSNITSAQDEENYTSELEINPEIQYRPRAWLTKKQGVRNVGIYSFTDTGQLKFDYFTVRDNLSPIVQTILFEQQEFNNSTYSDFVSNNIVSDLDINFPRALRKNVPFTDPPELNVNFPFFDGQNNNTKYTVQESFSNILSQISTGNSISVPIEIDTGTILDVKTENITPIANPTGDEYIHAICSI